MTPAITSRDVHSRHALLTDQAQGVPFFVQSYLNEKKHVKVARRRGITGTTGSFGKHSTRRSTTIIRYVLLAVRNNVKHEV